MARQTRGVTKMSETSRAAFSIGLVGASGWIGRSIGPALLRERVVEPGNLICFNRSGRSEHYADWPDVRWATSFGAPEDEADVIILSVRPQDFRQASFDCAGRLILSLMAGVTIDELRQRTGARRIARAMPNAAVEIGRSYSPWVALQTVTADDRQVVSAILNAVGASDEVESEADLNILTGLSGAGPAYAALLATTLQKAAEEAGLCPDIAARAAKAVVCDAAMQLSGKAAGEIVDEFIRYDGVIAAALQAARSAGFDESIRAALAAAMQKVGEMERSATPDGA